MPKTLLRHTLIKKIFLTFLLTPYLYTFSLYENPSFIIFSAETEVKENTDTASSASFLDLYLEFDDSGQISTKIDDEQDDFNFKIINFPNMCSNIPASPAYGVYISQLIRYARASSNDSDFVTH
jgi:hypothetical protein